MDYTNVFGRDLAIPRQFSAKNEPITVVVQDIEVDFERAYFMFYIMGKAKPPASTDPTLQYKLVYKVNRFVSNRQLNELCPKT